MIIRKTKSHYTLSRYGGVSNGKNLEVRIGSVQLGTNHLAVAADIVENLTPREWKELQEQLAADQKANRTSACSIASASRSNSSVSSNGGSTRTAPRRSFGGNRDLIAVQASRFKTLVSRTL